MKIEKVKPKFEPVIITIESQEELELLTALYKGCHSGISTKFNIQHWRTDRVYDELFQVLNSKLTYPNLEIKVI